PAPTARSSSASSWTARTSTTATMPKRASSPTSSRPASSIRPKSCGTRCRTRRRSPVSDHDRGDGGREARAEVGDAGDAAGRRHGRDGLLSQVQSLVGKEHPSAGNRGRVFTVYQHQSPASASHSGRVSQRGGLVAPLRGSFIKTNRSALFQIKRLVRNVGALQQHKWKKDRT